MRCGVVDGGELASEREGSLEDLQEAARFGNEVLSRYAAGALQAVIAPDEGQAWIAALALELDLLGGLVDLNVSSSEVETMLVDQDEHLSVALAPGARCANLRTSVSQEADMVEGDSGQ